MIMNSISIVDLEQICKNEGFFIRNLAAIAC